MTPDPVLAAVRAAVPAGTVLRPAPLRARPCDLRPSQSPLPSHTATWRDLVTTDTTHLNAELAPPLPLGWTDRWTVSIRRGDQLQNIPVSGLGWADIEGADPMTAADWHPARRARSGVEPMASTDRYHAFRSLFERRLLVALDFTGIEEVTSQPFTLRWHNGTRQQRHTPDFALRTTSGLVVLVNVRPAELLDERHHRNSAAAAAVAAARGWEFLVVSDYTSPAMEVVEACAYDRHAPDRAGLAGPLLDQFRSGPLTFAEAADSTDAFGFNRQLLRAMIHDGLLTMDLNDGLRDSTVLRLASDAR